MTDKEQVLKIVKDKNVKFIRLWFTDIMGQLKSFAITARELEDAMENGKGFDGSSITGYQDIEESDMMAMPDASTFRILPWRSQEHLVGRMICDIQTPEGEPYEGDPRYQLKRAIKRAEAMGFDRYNVGPELEYFYFKDSKGTEILDKGGYFDLTPLDIASDLRRDTVIALEELGINIECSHHEVGPSQHEIDIRYGDALKIADDAMTYRLVVKEIAQKYGVYATFMPKPMHGQAGNGMHVHQSLFKGSDNAFFDSEDKFFLSGEAKGYIAGLLKHASEISIVFAQWVNSYKRLVPGYEAPVYKAWSRRNRSALIRVPMYHTGQEKATRCEFRSPDPACNPYLTFAVMLQAGLDGIEKGYDLEDPMEMNLYDLTDDEREEMGIEMLPESLGEAIHISRHSEFLKQALGDHVFNRMIELKQNDWDEYRTHLTQWEMDKYLSVL
jgi:glutamine synthetase